MATDLQKNFIWDAASLGAGLRILLTKKGLYNSELPITEAPRVVTEEDLDKLDIWFEINAQAHNLEMVPEHWVRGITKQIISGCAPGVIRLNLPSGFGFIFAFKANSRFLSLLSKSGEIWNVRTDNVLKYVQPQSTSPKKLARIEEIIEGVDLPDERKSEILKILDNQQRKDDDVRGIWTIRFSHDIGFWKQLKLLGLIPNAVIASLLILFGFLVFVGSWSAFAFAVETNRLNTGWLMIWILLLMTSIPMNMLVNYKLGILGVNFSQMFKGMFFGEMLNIAKEKIKTLGMGGFLSIAIESEIIESNIIQGSVILVVACFELTVLAGLLLMTGSLWILGIALVLWIGIYLYSNRKYLDLYRTWVEMRSNMSHELLEKVQGFRTIKVQYDIRKLDREEDLELINYHLQCNRLDNFKVIISGLADRGWLAFSLIILTPLVMQSMLSTGQLLASLGIILLSAGSLGRLDLSVKYLVGSIVSWARIAPYLKNEKASQLTESRLYIDEDAGAIAKNDDLISIVNMDFKYPDRQRFVIERLSMQVKNREHVILTGSSGGGKSTLAKLINLTLPPNSGKIFLNGLDHMSWSTKQWRKKIVYVPQFHNNHIFNATFLFNVLMARRWPPTEEDRDTAESVCGALGLGPLMWNMPQGVQQMVGESGWRLSHGEKSRIFIARGILQYPDLLILDESLAAIDPETTEQVFDVITSFTKTCVIIAHP